jgi:hypothetical protein
MSEAERTAKLERELIQCIPKEHPYEYLKVGKFLARGEMVQNFLLKNFNW